MKGLELRIQKVSVAPGLRLPADVQKPLRFCPGHPEPSSPNVLEQAIFGGAKPSDAIFS